MQCYFRDPVQSAAMMGMPGQYNPMMNMTQPQLESMYPNTYHIIQPQVENMCDNMEAYHGKMYCPTHEEMDNMVNDIYDKVEGDVEAATEQNPNEKERQFLGGGRRLLRDIIGILLINSLIRRRRPFHDHPGYMPYGGYMPYSGSMPYGGYPNY